MDAIKTGSFIKDMRKEKGFTQQQFAERLNVSDKAVSRWETGKGFPDIGSLMDIAEVLEVSVAEILKGERFGKLITEGDVAEASSNSLSFARQYVKTSKIRHMLLGFMAGLILFIVAFIYVTSPIYIRNAESAIRIETLSSGGVVAVMSEKTMGYDIHAFENDELGNTVFITCYETILGRMMKKGKVPQIVLVGNENEIDRIYYYPHGNNKSDRMIWQKEGLANVSASVVTLPSMTLNAWILIGSVVSLAGVGIYLLFRFVLKKKYLTNVVLKVAAVPGMFTLAVALSMIGNKGKGIYDPGHYLAGVVILFAALYALFLMVVRYGRGKS
ncbi:MAG: helix-turn-helix domain-containing protein [Lachnospiraceae bacterium]|nr:helix-turn-helix domain-containing protein [Lachnospiraceae bacterium]